LFVPLSLRPRATLLFNGIPTVGNSALADKLQVGGATGSVIADAVLLRASASFREQELLQLGGDVASLLADLQTKVRIRGNAVAATHASDSKPALGIWADLLAQFTDHAAALDTHNLLDRSPELLLGELCEVSDMCRFDWGVADEA
jgi:hypothetical protein